MPPRLIVIGAGPVGIAAALEAVDRKYDVTLFEAGEAGDALLRWGTTRFFSPLSMNVTPRMRAMIDPSMRDDDIMTGREYMLQVMQRIVVQDPLRSRIRTRHRVRAIGRRGLTRGEFANHPLRSERVFRLLVDTPDGEQIFESEIVLDATGGFRVPRAIGSGGLPAPGEARSRDVTIRSLSELESAKLQGKRVLLVGNGHSAANAIAVLSRAGALVTWAVRTANSRVCEEVANDSLPERRRVVAAANDLAETPPSWLTVERRAMIEGIEQTDRALRVALTGGRTAIVDVIAAFTGYRPDASMLTELAVEISPVTEGGARLQRTLANVTDCLNVPAIRRHDLESGEPNFFFVGSRAYGRSRAFLLQAGFQQLTTIFEGLPH